jgi:hypothetical protein
VKAIPLVSRRVELLASKVDENAAAICPWCGYWIEVGNPTSSTELETQCYKCAKFVIIEFET